MKMEDRTLYVKQVDEEFRDIGQIQQCINSRRRRFIQARKAIEDAEVKFVSGQQAAGSDESKIAQLENESQYTEIDSFQEIE